MALMSKPYPKAVPCHSAEELAAQNKRLHQANEELAVQAKRLTQANDLLQTRAAALRTWTWRLATACVISLLLLAGGVTATVKYPVLIPAARHAEAARESPADAITKDAKVGGPSLSNKVAPTVLPARAIAKPEAGFAVGAVAAPSPNHLEALGSLSATHLYQCHLNIGLLADGVEAETYTIEEAEKNLKTVLELMTLVDGQLASVVRTGLDPEDQDSIRQIQAVSALLRIQADSLRAYWANSEADQAERYHKARKASWQGLSRVMGFDS